MNNNRERKRFLGMKSFKKIHLLQLLFLLIIFFRISISQEIPVIYCGNIRIQAPFFHQNSSYSSIFSHMILCKSDKLYFRTSIGLFPVSSIDYTNKLLIVSHSSCSSASHFLSPHHLSAGFPLSRPNSLLLFNCSNQSSDLSLFPCNNTRSIGFCGSSSKYQNQELAKGNFSSCSFIDDVEKLDKSFHPKHLNCTNYSHVYRSSEKLELGMRISFDIPDHVPNPCNECEKPDGNCGAGLRCVCHPKKCKDKVISGGAVVKPRGSMLVYMVFIIFFIGFFRGF